MDDQRPNWPSAIVAIGFLAAVTVIFVVVYMKDGLDGALKAWGAIGTLVGVVIGAIPTFFFRRAAQEAQENTKKLLQAVDEPTLVRARGYGFKG